MGVERKGRMRRSEKTPSFPPQVPMRAGSDRIKETIDGDISNEAD